MKNEICPITTTVIDVGARYGMHPTWSKFEGELSYIAFEPDTEEAERLRDTVKREGYEVLPIPLGSDENEKPFYITRHRGFCSFYKPALGSFYFRRARPGQGDIERTVMIKPTPLDSIANQRKLHIDFLKIDTEGFDYEVLRGAATTIEDSVLGVRTEMHFQACYEDQPLFTKTFDFLVERGFMLLNIEYFGRGVPAHELYRNPNPLGLDSQRYGYMVGFDGAFVRDYEWIVSRYECGGKDSLAAAIFKFATFCFYNFAPDLGLDTLERFLVREKRAFSDAVGRSKLYRNLRYVTMEYLGQYRTHPEGADWPKAQELAKSLFGVDIEGGSGYWELMRGLSVKG